MAGEGHAAISKLEAKVETLVEEVQRLLGDSAAPNKLKRQKELLTKATALKHIAVKLKEALSEDEDEALTTRLVKTENRLTDLADSLEPDEVEEAYLNSAKRGSIVTVTNSNAEDDDDEDEDDEDEDDEDEDDDDDDNEGEEDDEEGEDEAEESHTVSAIPIADKNDLFRETTAKSEEKEPELPIGLRACRAIYDFDPEQEGDLELKDGEIVRILSVRPDGWWEAENQWGKEG